MDRFVASLFERLFLPPREVHGMRDEHVAAPGQSTSTGKSDVSEESPPDLSEYPSFPFAPAPSADVVPQEPQPMPPPTMSPVSTSAPYPTMPPVSTPAPQTTKSSADRIYRRHLMALAATFANQMATNDIFVHELAEEVGCSTGTIEALLAGKSGELTLDGLAKTAEKLGLLLVVQLRPFAPQTGAQPAGRVGS
jgi:DNA-binding Xre family transcriptional regulator